MQGPCSCPSSHRGSPSGRPPPPPLGQTRGQGPLSHRERAEIPLQMSPPHLHLLQPIWGTGEETQPRPGPWVATRSLRLGSHITSLSLCPSLCKMGLKTTYQRLTGK